MCVRERTLAIWANASAAVKATNDNEQLPFKKIKSREALQLNYKSTPMGVSLWLCESKACTHVTSTLWSFVSHLLELKDGDEKEKRSIWKLCSELVVVQINNLHLNSRLLRGWRAASA